MHDKGLTQWTIHEKETLGLQDMGWVFVDEWW